MQTTAKRHTLLVITLNHNFNKIKQKRQRIKGGMKRYTFIYATRNDFYCGDAPLRLITSLRALTSQLARCDDLKHEVEILVIDWNSPTNGTLLTHPYFAHDQFEIDVTFIEVPKETAIKYSTSGVSEVHAYNVGARLAQGIFLLRMDQDIVVGQRFISFLQTHTTTDLLSSRKAWWCSRKETHPRYMLRGEQAWNEFMSSPCTFVNTYGDALPMWYQQKFFDGVGAVGVFGMSKRVWYELEGYNESMTGWGHMENEMALRMKQCDIRWRNIHDDIQCDCYHIWHSTAHGRNINESTTFPERNQSLTWGCIEDIHNSAMRGITILKTPLK